MSDIQREIRIRRRIESMQVSPSSEGSSIPKSTLNQLLLRSGLNVSRHHDADTTRIETISWI